MPKGGGPKMDRATRWKLAQQAKQMADAGMGQREIAARFGVSQPTISTWLRKLSSPGPQQRVADLIRADMVCCDIYQRSIDADDDMTRRQLRASNDWHDICYYGEWAARLAERTP